MLLLPELVENLLDVSLVWMVQVCWSLVPHRELLLLMLELHQRRCGWR
jgi:hypothetical protein